jgi:monoamine oxidase
MKRLLKALDIPTFGQPDDPSSTRIDGGAVEIVHALAKNLPSDRIRLNIPVTSLTLVNATDSSESCSVGSGGEKLIRLETPEGPILAKRVVLAVPPKIASKHIRFEPPLSNAKQQAMAGSHTWMAGVTKVSLVFEKKFWSSDYSNMGLPRQLPGPAFQMYDASTKDGSVNAITFFALVPPGSRSKSDDEFLGNEVASQVANVWNMLLGRGDLKDQVMNYKSVHVQHWPTETYISEDPNPTQIQPHPHPIGALSTIEWDGRLFFAGSEADRQSSGVMEGAVGSALRVVRELVSEIGK